MLATHFRPIDRLFSLFAMLLFSMTTSAQYCNIEQIQQNISSSNFKTDVEPGSIRDATTGLIWNRCVLGQKWSVEKNTCIGIPTKYTWSEALTAATLPYNGVSTWRLPNIKEVVTIISYQCLLPPLNSTLFPNAPASINHGLWTSSPVFIYINANEPSARIWSVDLNTGGFFQHFVNTDNYVMLVR